MAITAFSGPQVIYGVPPSTGTENPNEYNQQNGPGMCYALGGLLDNQWGYFPGQPGGRAVLGWAAGINLNTLSYAPVTASASNIASVATVTGGTAIALASTAVAGITPGVSITSRGNGQVITGLLAIDGVVGTITHGSVGTMQTYDPRTTCGRAISITGVSGGTGTGAWVVRGYDYLNNPMTENITGPTGATTTNGKKAFKYIYSITPTTSDAHAYTVGTIDVFGFPIRADDFTSLEIYFNGSAVGSGTGTFTFADVTNPATATTGDVRGTWTSSPASDSSKVLGIQQGVQPYNAPGSNNVYTVKLTTNGTTAAGNATLHFASVPSTVVAGMSIWDSTTQGSIPPGVTVLSTTSTTVVMSANANLQVGGTDVIQFGTASPTIGVFGLPQFFSASGTFG